MENSKLYKPTRNHIKAIVVAKSIWDSASPADSQHQYLINKGIQPHDVRQTRRDGQDVLLVPMKDKKGEMWNLQRIYPNGEKLFLNGGRVTGKFFTFGCPNGVQVICEGYATGASIHEATDLCVHVAFNCNNLKAVAEAIDALYPEADLIIAADDDHKTEGNPGLTKANEAANAVNAKVVKPEWEEFRGDEDTDFNDLFTAYGAEVVRCCFEMPSAPSETQKGGRINEAEKKKSIASKLVELAKDQCELFVNQNKESHARIPFEGHHEVYRVDSSLFHEWLAKKCWETDQSAPSDIIIKSVIATLAGIAKFEGDQRQVFLRIGQLEERIYLDLANDDWECVEIDRDGWRVLESSPVLFVRSESMRPLPHPQRSGDIDLLWKHVNVKEEDKLLLLSWMVECFRRDTPDPLLELTGEQGSGKSLTHNNIRELIDPNRVNLRTPPNRLDDLLIPASHSLLVSIENASNLSANMQDRLCTLSTGGGFAVRSLYTTSEETAIELQRPVIINGISPVVSRPDLLDRSLVLDLPRLEERKTAKSLNKEFERDKFLILGALLDLISNVLYQLPSIQIPPKVIPRMGDFAQCGEAVFKEFDHPYGEFLTAYKDNNRKGIQRTLESSPVGLALLAYMENHPNGFNGTIKQLLAELEILKPEMQGEGWVKSARGLGDALRRLGPALRLNGIEVIKEDKPRMDGFHVVIRCLEEEPESVHELHEHYEHVPQTYADFIEGEYR